MTSPALQEDRDARLAELLDRLMADAAAGRMADLDAACREHPDLADELRSLWATAQVAGLLAGTALSDDPAEGGAGSPLAISPTLDATSDPLADYELLDELGRGGMGVVYRARQRSLGRTVALKMIVRPDLAGPAELARFRGEAEAAAKLDHPHIVPIYEVGATGGPDGRPYFTMRLVEGQTLAQMLADGPLDGRTAARLLAPVCRAVHEAHERGLVHRDLKPSNILIDAEGRPYVSDFGLAKQWGDGGRGEAGDGGTFPRLTRSPVSPASFLSDPPLTVTGAILGTPSYMSPEQAAGRRDVGPAADVYSLGAILYACLTGRPPFQAASPAETVLMVLDHDPPPPRLVNPQADPDLEVIALKALQKPADLRYASAAALADDLDAYLAHEPIAARSTRFYDVLSRAFRETHHAQVLENGGLLWMWHAVALLGLCLVTNALQLWGVSSRWPYLLLWTAGLGVWAGIFWSLRRRAGPVTFVERQIAHAWAGSMACSTLLYLVEALLGLPVLTLSPVLGLVSGMVFLTKAAILSGLFYLPAAALFATAPLMALWPRLLGGPNLAITMFGVVSAACFFLPGLKYWKQARR
ncbi:MAG TPA: serine/threonine-protein kinase [Planctomycetaceae bacterium]